MSKHAGNYGREGEHLLLKHVNRFLDARTSKESIGNSFIFNLNILKVSRNTRKKG